MLRKTILTVNTVELVHLNAYSIEKNDPTLQSLSFQRIQYSITELVGRYIISYQGNKEIMANIILCLPTDNSLLFVLTN